MTSFGGEILEGFARRTKIVGWIFYAVLATAGLLFILGASSFKEEYAARITFGMVLLLPLFFRLKKVYKTAEKEGSFKILQRLTLTEGGLVVVCFFLIVAGVIFIITGFTNPKHFAAHLVTGIAVVGFASSCIYHTVKIHKRR